MERPPEVAFDQRPLYSDGRKTSESSRAKRIHRQHLQEVPVLHDHLDIGAVIKSRLDGDVDVDDLLQLHGEVVLVAASSDIHCHRRSYWHWRYLEGREKGRCVYVCVCVCVCVFIKLHITAQSGLVILVILCHSR